VTATRDPRRPEPEELRSLFLFAELTDAQIDELCRIGRVETVPKGLVFREGEPAESLFVLIEGNLVTTRKVGDDEVELVRSTRPGIYSGALLAYLEDRRSAALYVNSMRATVRSRFYVMPAADFGRVMREWFPMPVHLLEGMFAGVRGTQHAVEQRERLLALGSLSAGLTHELNNPATAVVSATAAMQERVTGMREALAVLVRDPEQSAALELLVDLVRDAVGRVAAAPRLGALAASDAEDEISDWLEDHGVPEGWQLAQAFVIAGTGIDLLEQVSDAVPASLIEPAVRWIHQAVATELLIGEITDAVTRISTLVGAAKQYSQLDRAPYREADIHKLLDSTLLMLSGKIAKSIKIVKIYAKNLPRIPCYAAERNQVWTNIIDNAAAAMGEAGMLTVRTALEDEQALIEFGDTGPGIPDDMIERIFEPFFTTKPVGEGTGLGLDISYRIVVNKHHGDLRVESRPGDTRFQVRLPLAPPPGTEPAREHA